MSMGRVGVVREKKSRKNNSAARKAESRPPKRTLRRPLKGVQTLKSMINPEREVTITEYWPSWSGLRARTF